MRRWHLRVSAALLTQSLLGASTPFGQGAPEAPPAAEAPRRQYDWAQIFPVTPPLSEWERFDASIGSMFLRKGGIRKIAAKSPTYEVDLLLYVSVGERVDYYRNLMIVGCGSPTIYMIKAEARVTVSPDGEIIPASPVEEQHGLQRLEGRQGPLGQICFNPNFRAEFMTEQ